MQGIRHVVSKSHVSVGWSPKPAILVYFGNFQSWNRVSTPRYYLNFHFTDFIWGKRSRRRWILIPKLKLLAVVSITVWRQTVTEKRKEKYIKGTMFCSEASATLQEGDLSLYTILYKSVLPSKHGRSCFSAAFVPEKSLWVRAASLHSMCRVPRAESSAQYLWLGALPASPCSAWCSAPLSYARGSCLCQRTSMHLEWQDKSQFQTAESTQEHVM